MLNKARIAVLVSGGGTNLEALLNAQEAGALPHVEIVLVLSSNPEAYALERAKRRGVPAIPLSRKQLGQEPFEAALMEALMLSDVCARVTIVQDLDHLTGEKSMQEALSARENVRILTGQRILGLLSEDGKLTGLRLKAARGETRLPVSGLFVAIGLIPDNEPFADQAALDSQGYVAARDDCLTDHEGVFAAGDCRTKAVRQIATAVADGAVAALAACRYLNR